LRARSPAPPPNASAITFSYTGAITQVAALDPENPFPVALDFGSPFSGTYTFNGAAPDGAADAASGSYLSSGPVMSENSTHG
jgi:hypothetical protein